MATSCIHIAQVVIETFEVVPNIFNVLNKTFNVDKRIPQAFLYPLTRSKGDGDVWDGKLLKNWTEEDIRSKTALAMSSDAAVMQTWKQTSWTPVVAQMLKLPPHLRTTFHGYLLLGMFPPSDALLDYMEMNECFSGFPSENAAAAGDVTDQRLAFSHFVEDTKGLQKWLLCKQCPVFVGMCPLCTIQGFSHCRKTVYIGAVTHLCRYNIHINCM